MGDFDNDHDNEKTFYCQVETHRATKDYLMGGRCVRLIAIKPPEFSSDALAAGVTTFTVDIDFWIFCELTLGVPNWSRASREDRQRVEQRDADLQWAEKWFRLELKFKSRAKNYLYKTFSTDSPQYFDVVSLEVLNTGPQIRPLALARSTLPAPQSITAECPFSGDDTTDRPFVFDAFHVGQGMCSLVHDGARGVLLDMGAGKPVTRDAYQKHSIANDLRPALTALETVLLVVSHADSDHWRILGWDPSLLARIGKIYAPVNAISLALQDKAVNKKIEGLGDTTWRLNATTTLRLLRSDPSCHDENGKCLVAIFERDGLQVLAPGDYVYERFTTDKNQRIQALHQSCYAAVVVPHHGDKASSMHLVAPTGVAKAFFSAGTHQSWQHPTEASLDAHAAGRFSNISKPTEPNIVKVNLV